MTSTTPAPDTSPPFDRVVVVHGFAAAPDQHWFPWLASTMAGVEVLTLPTPQTPVADEWIRLVAEAIGRRDPRTAVVAHSLGCVTAAQALSTGTTGGERVGAFVAVAPFGEKPAASGDPDLDAFAEHGLPGFLRGYDPATVRARAVAARVIRSDDDPSVPAAASDRFARDLGADVQVVPSAGHFCADDGVTRLEPVLAALRECASFER